MTTRSSWSALFLSLFLPGLGQLYNGQPKKALFLLTMPFIVLILFTGLLAISPLVLSVPVTIISILGWMIYYFGSLIDAFRSAHNQGSTYRLTDYNRFYVYVVVFVAYWMCFNAYRSYFRENWFEPYLVPTESMAPTLITGDSIYADKRSGSLSNIQRGELVLYRSPKDPKVIYIKRVIGIGGDKVDIMGREVHINGNLIETTKMENPSSGHNMEDTSIQVPQGHLFILGDNRDNSWDSRGHGTIPTSNIVGKPFQIWMSYDSKTSSVRWSRFGKAVRNVD